MQNQEGDPFAQGLRTENHAHNVLHVKLLFVTSTKTKYAKIAYQLLIND